MTLEALHWNRTLIQRYDLAGPRYTSYPTAPQFVDDYPVQEVYAAIERGNAAEGPLSLYVHIPFCDTICYYCGCNKIVTANKARARPYLDLLQREIARWAERFDHRRRVEQLHWGGGTPTFISDSEKRELMATLGRHFNLASTEDRDYSIEIHPGGLSPDTLGVLRALGFNRLSMGIQDFDPGVQRAVNRFNSVEEVRALSERARREGFRSISMDLIYGLPLQNLDTMTATLDQVIELAPDRLSLFNYAHLPHLFKSQRQIDASTLPEPQEKLRMLEQAVDHLQRAGYVYIGMDHFARPGDSLAVAQSRGELHRNFQGYTTHGNCDLLGLGLSSISALDGIYVQNHKDMDRYARAIDSGGLAMSRGLSLTPEDGLRREVINQLICHFELDFAPLEARYGIDFRQHFSEAWARLQPMAKDGLLRLLPGRIEVTGDGRPLIRRICMAFDAYLQAPVPVRYSRIL